MKYNNFRYCKFFCCYSAKFNDIKFKRYFKLCFLIFPLNCLLDDVMQCFSFTLFFFNGLLVFKFLWQLGLSIIMNVNCCHGENHFLCRFIISTLCLVPTKLKMLFYLSLNSQNSFFLFQTFSKSRIN